MKKAEYKVVSGANGFRELEENVSKLLNEGWKLIGGIGFNAGFPYQAMARVSTVATVTETVKQDQGKARGAQDAMRAVDELT